MITPLTLAKLSQAAYLVDPHAAADAVKAVGLEFLGLIGISDCQALVARSDTDTVVALRGTQVEEHFSPEELWDDADGVKIALGGGTMVRAGFWRGLTDLWPQLRQYIDPARSVTGTGHSKGAIQALELAALLPPTTPYAATVFAPPKGANTAFWHMAYNNRKPPLIFGRGADFALNWSPLDRDCSQPVMAELHWLADGKTSIIPGWPLASESVADHSVDLYVADLAALETAS